MDNSRLDAIELCTKSFRREPNARSLKRYCPAGSVTPGRAIGPLKRVRLLRGCADAVAAMRQTNTATAQAKPKTRVLSMIGSLFAMLFTANVVNCEGGARRGTRG